MDAPVDPPRLKPKGPPKPPPRRAALAHPMALTAAALGLLACGYLAAYALAPPPLAPLGVPLPEPPEPQFKLLKSAGGGPSLLERRLPEAWIVALAPQPDGLPPLERSFGSIRLDLTLRLPYGFEAIEYPDEMFQQNGVDSFARAAIEQQLHAVRASLVSPAEGEDWQALLERIPEVLREQGADTVAAPAQVELEETRAYVVEYTMPGEPELAHLLYLLPLPKVVIQLDFSFKPEQAADGRRMTEKVLQSLELGDVLRGQLRESGMLLPVDAAAAADAAEPAATSNIIEL